MKNFTKLMLTGTILFSCLGGVKAESAIVERLALTGMTTWGSIERTNEVLDGTDLVSATYTASANYRDCFNYSDLDVSAYDAISIETSEAPSGKYQIYAKIGGGDIYRDFNGTCFTLPLANVSTLQVFCIRAVKGADGTNDVSSENKATIKITSVKLIKYGEIVRQPLTGMTTWGSIERTNEVLDGTDLVSATYTASANYRDCFNYSDLDVSAYDAISIKTSEAPSGVYQVYLKINDADVYDTFTGTEYFFPLEGVSTLQVFCIRAVKGADGTNDVDSENKATIKITRVSLLSKNVTRDITVGAAGYSTFSTDKAVDVTGVVTAYKASYDGSKVVLTEVTEIPAGAGVIIEAAAGTYTVPAIETAAALTGNDLLVSDGTITGDGTIFVLANGTSGVGFYKLKTGDAVPAGKAYLNIPASSNDFIGFDDTTGISDVKGKKEEVRDVYFDLQGRRVANPTKGLYIVNGKKVIIK